VQPYSNPDDMTRIIEFLQVARPPEHADDFPARVDLEELLADSEIQRSTRLWLDAQGGLSAYAILNEDSLLFDTLPAQLPSLGVAIIQWAIGQARQANLDVLCVSCPDDHMVCMDFLVGLGFELQPDATLHYARSFDRPFPDPVLPPGFTIRVLNGEAEAAIAADLHRAAFGTDYMTTENRLVMMRTSEYDPTLDLVAVAPDGRLAAYTMGSISAEENLHFGRRIGYLDPLATHPDFQRLGLARALLLTGLRMLKERGVQTARLGTDSENLAMQKTAESAGFLIEKRTLRFKLSV